MVFAANIATKLLTFGVLLLSATEELALEVEFPVTSSTLFLFDPAILGEGGFFDFVDWKLERKSSSFQFTKSVTELATGWLLDKEELVSSSLIIAIGTTCEYLLYIDRV